MTMTESSRPSTATTATTNAATAATGTVTPSEQADLTAVKARQQAMWSSGDYAVIGATLQIVGEQLCETADLRSGETVLDVATGNGGTALAAARRSCQVTGVDYVESLLARARRRAEADGLSIDFRAGDAEMLPFEDAAFDVVTSTFGVMFAPDHRTAAAELLRVTRPGGRIALANWAPDGFIGHMFRTIGAHVPPPVGVASPALWGTRAHLEDLFGAGVSQLAIIPRTFHFRYRSAAEFLATFRTFYGPMLKAFEALDGDGQIRLASDVIALAESHNTASDSLVVPSAYVDVVAVRT
jgi:ubiquinone/menaquinone biosynthesis C-methylase UbiE